MNAPAQHYFLSEKGNDNNTGKNASSPWRSLKKLQEHILSLQPGDSILLEKGSTFRGSLHIQQAGLPEKNIFIGSYGYGPKPIINGAILITGWTKVKKNLWKVNCNTEPRDLYLNGIPQPLGRYPDNGFLEATPLSKDTNQLQDAARTERNNYWNGAELVVQTSRWTLDILPVTSFIKTIFHVGTPPSYPFPKQTLYFIQNHEATLSISGEWFYDKEKQELFLYHETLNPNTVMAEISQQDYGLSIDHASHITVDGLSFKYQRSKALRIDNSFAVTIKNNTIEHAGLDGLVISSGKNILVQNNRITDCHNNGVVWTSNDDGIFSGNTVTRTGLMPGRGGSGTGTYIALYITGNNESNNTFQYNTIDSTGYSAIDFRTRNTTIKNNIIRYFCLVKDDGGGIYTWGNTAGKNSIDQNIIIGSKENPNQREWYCHGLYMDDRTENISITNNTILYCARAGILIRNATNLLIDANTLVGNGSHFTNNEKAQLIIQFDALVNNQSQNQNLTISHNTFTSTYEDQKCVTLSFQEKVHFLNSSFHFRANEYNSIQNKIISMHIENTEAWCNTAQNYTLAEWKRFSDNDHKSVQHQLPLPSYIPTTSFKPLSTEGWMTWPEGSQLSMVNNKLKVDPPSNHSPVMLYQAGFQFSNKKIYRLSFTIKSSKTGEIEFVPLSGKAPWEAIGNYQCFKTDSVSQNIIYYFQPAKNSRYARLNFKSQQSFWIDAVSLQEVKPQNNFEVLLNFNKKPLTVRLTGEYQYPDGSHVKSEVIIPSYSTQLVFKK